MSPIEEISSIAHLLPTKVLQDIDNRITDWMAAGGNDNDPYIHQQLRYARNVAYEVRLDATAEHI